MANMQTLKRRFGLQVLPIAAPNVILSYLIFFAYKKIGLNRLINSLDTFIFVFLLVNIVPVYAIYYILRYNIAFDEWGVWVTPLTKRGPLTAMRFDEIETVDLKPQSDLGNIPNARANPSVIALYRKGWDGYEQFVLDPSRTNLRQFKDLVRLLHERRPETFTENALRYLTSPQLITPRENRRGELVW